MILVAVLVAACAPGALSEAVARAEAFDLPGALEAARRVRDCDEAAAAVDYVEGLLGARNAIATGGTEDALRDVRSAANALARRAETGERRWEAASMAMRAVAAASQSERGEMSIYLAEATRLEALAVAAGLPPLPLVSAHELSGDLWLQVHRFEDARKAYAQASNVVGRTGRVRLGLARSAARLADTPGACAEYGSLLEWWNGREGEPPEIAEARTFVASPDCKPGR